MKWKEIITYIFKMIAIAVGVIIGTLIAKLLGL